MNKIFLLICVSVIFIPSCDCFQLKEGDLLFQIGKGSDLEQSVSAATAEQKNFPFTHVGIADSKREIWEATPKQGVHKISLADFLEDALKIQNRPAVVVFRLKKPYQKFLPSALKRIRSLQNKPYDELFDAENDAYYCSELIQQTFLDKELHPLFPSIPMNFTDRRTGEILSYWKAHFDKYTLPVPQGKPGSNPANLSQSALLKQVYSYF